MEDESKTALPNRYSPITIVSALDSQFSDPPFPTELVRAGRKRPKRSAAIINNIRSDQQTGSDWRSRLTGLPPTRMKRVDEAFKISLGRMEL